MHFAAFMVILINVVKYQIAKPTQQDRMVVMVSIVMKEIYGWIFAHEIIFVSLHESFSVASRLLLQGCANSSKIKRDQNNLVHPYLKNW